MDTALAKIEALSFERTKLQMALSEVIAAIGDWSRPTGANGMTAARADHPLVIAAEAARSALNGEQG